MSFSLPNSSFQMMWFIFVISKISYHKQYKNLIVKCKKFQIFVC